MTTLMSDVRAALEAELELFQWAYPDRADNRGEVEVDPDLDILRLTVWVRDSDDPDDETIHPLLVETAIEPFTSPREQIRHLIHSYLTHEADEQMWFGSGVGERSFYPRHPVDVGAQ